MLGKLIKHEFRATARLMLPLFLVVVLLSVTARVLYSDIFLAAIKSEKFYSILGTLITIAFVIALVIVTVFSVVLMVSRFYRNLMTDEGYLMFTLPAGVHRILWSKLIVSAVWFLATFAIDALAIFIAVSEGGELRNLFDALREFLSQLDTYYALNGAAFVLELLVLALLSLLVTCLNFYAPIAIGHSFANHKTLLSVVFYFALSAFWEVVFVVLSWSGITWLDSSSALIGNASNIPATLTLAHSLILSVTVWMLVVGAAMYFLTWFMLRKHRNLQ